MLQRGYLGGHGVEAQREGGTKDRTHSQHNGCANTAAGARWERAPCSVTHHACARNAHRWHVRERGCHEADLAWWLEDVGRLARGQSIMMTCLTSAMIVVSRPAVLCVDERVGCGSRKKERETLRLFLVSVCTVCRCRTKVRFCAAEEEARGVGYFSNDVSMWASPLFSSTMFLRAHSSGAVGEQDCHGMLTCVGVFACMRALFWVWIQSRHSAWARCRVSGWKKVLSCVGETHIRLERRCDVTARVCLFVRFCGF